VLTLNRREQVNEKNGNIAHPEMLAFRGTRTRLQKPQDLCDKSGIRHTQDCARLLL